MGSVPGRFNLLEMNGATIILDYGHNVSALQALIDAIEPFPQERRTVVYSAAGDRRDEDLVRQGEMLGDAFDRVVLYEDQYVRGRQPGEIMSLFRKGLESGSRVGEVREFQGALKAVDAVVREARPGDLILIQPDVIDTTIALIETLMKGRDGGREIDLTEALDAPEGVALAVGVFAQAMD